MSLCAANSSCDYPGLRKDKPAWLAVSSCTPTCCVMIATVWLVIIMYHGVAWISTHAVLSMPCHCPYDPARCTAGWLQPRLPVAHADHASQQPAGEGEAKGGSSHEASLGRCCNNSRQLHVSRNHRQKKEQIRCCLAGSPSCLNFLLITFTRLTAL